ncbi:MAG: pirin family protein [Myxococcota bacterium]
MATYEVFDLDRMPWKTRDPFLFCVHHLDRYPAGNKDMTPNASLIGRMIGQDFAGKDGWNMYHGQRVAGFPPHPHRGFETVTVIREGFVDHSDSLGAAARFGAGDVQWMTAGGGIVHSEMFPLLDTQKGNVNDFFQIWINLPGRDKMVEPHFSMLWSEDIPRMEVRDDGGKATQLVVSAGDFDGKRAPKPPPRSWAAKPENHVRIMTITIEPDGTFQLPAAASKTVARTLYFFSGESITLDGDAIAVKSGVDFGEPGAVRIKAGVERAELLLLEGEPIGEPVAHYGPFVMNTQSELKQAFMDYQRTQFGGWPWKSKEPVHERKKGRFARHADGRIEERA